MSVKEFLKVVEIQTKVASLFPFLVGVLFSFTYFQQIDWLNTLVFFVAMVVFDMATTAINNYMDFQKAVSQEYKYEENIIGKAQIQPKLVLKMIFAMLVFVLGLGIWLTLQTGWLLLVMGGICCFIGIFYTSGPIPLSRMPLGEVFSGVTMGLGIVAITVYVNTYDEAFFDLKLSLATGLFTLSGNVWALAAIVWAALPLVLTIANIMLANNIRDLDTDVKNQRFTLVFYLGRKQSIQLFKWAMLTCYGVVVLGWLIGVYSWPILLAFLSLGKVRQNLAAYMKSVPQPQSFGYAISNMVLFNGSYVLGLLGVALWQIWQG